MNCREIDELVAAYALDALTPEEREEVRRHLATCAAHDAVLAGLRDAVGAIERSVEVTEPRASLKSQIMQAVRDDAPGAPATQSPALAPTRPARRWSLGGFGFSPVVGVLSVLVLGLLVWNIALQSSGDEDAFVRYMKNGEDIHGWVYYVEQVGVITVEGLQPLAPGQTYQAWATIDGEVAHLGTIKVSDDGQGYVLLERHVTEKEPVFITIEPDGATAPSGSTVLSTEAQ